MHVTQFEFKRLTLIVFKTKLEEEYVYGRK